MWHYYAIVERIVDGDTVDISADCGFKIYTRQRLRVARIDTPEIRGEERPEGLVSKARVEELIPPGTRIEIKTEKTGKYGRYIAEILFELEGVMTNLSDLLVAEGLAEYREY